MADTEPYGWDDLVSELMANKPEPTIYNSTKEQWIAQQHHEAVRMKFIEQHWSEAAWALVGVLAFVIVLIASWVQRRRNRHEAEWRRHLAGAHGTAEFQQPEDMRANGLAGKKVDAGLILGRIGSTDELIRFDKDGHVLTFAPTGAGKGVSAVMPNLLDYRGSVVVIDPKGESAFVTARRRRELGQDVHILDPFGKMGDGAASAAFNPLDWIDPDGDEAAEDAALLAEALAPADGRSADPFWANEARALIAGLLLYIVAHEPPESRHLGRLRDFLSLSGDEWRGLLEQMRESPNPLVVAAGNRMSQKAEKEAASVLSTAQSHTHFLDSRRIRSVLEKTTVDLTAVKKRPMTVFLILPAEQLQNHGRWLRLMISSLLRAVTRDQTRPDDDVLFLLDEFAALGALPMIRQAFGLMRGYGLKIWTILQDLPQLQALYHDGWQTFIANAGVIQFFGTNDRATAEYASHMMGQETIKTRSNSYSDHGASSSYSVTGRPLMLPDEVLRIRPVDELLLLRSMSPIMCARVIYHEDGRFSKAADPNPYVRRKKA